MRETRIAMALVLLFVISLVPVPVSSASETESGYTVPMQFATTTPSGILIYRVENPAGVGIDGVRIDKGDLYSPFAPIHLAFVSPNGHVRSFRETDWGSFTSGARNLVGAEGNLYVGGPDSTEKSEASTEFEYEGIPYFFGGDFDETEGWFVFTWAYFDDAFESVVHANWTTGTTIELAYAGTDVAAASNMDFRHGVRAGVSPAAVAHVADGFETSGAQMYALLAWHRTGAAGVGEFAFGDAETSHSYSLTATHEEDFRDVVEVYFNKRLGVRWEEFADLVGTEETNTSLAEIERETGHPVRQEIQDATTAPLVSDGQGCIVCDEYNYAIFTGTEKAWAKLTYVGYSRQMRVGVVFVALPAGTLPDAIFLHKCWSPMPGFQQMACDPPGRF